MNSPLTSSRPPRYITAAELRELLRVSESTVKRLLVNEGLPLPLRTTPGNFGHRRWIQSEVVDWMNSRREVVEQ